MQDRSRLAWSPSGPALRGCGQTSPAHPATSRGLELRASQPQPCPQRQVHLLCGAVLCTVARLADPWLLPAGCQQHPLRCDNQNCQMSTGRTKPTLLRATAITTFLGRQMPEAHQLRVFGGFSARTALVRLNSPNLCGVGSLMLTMIMNSEAMASREAAEQARSGPRLAFICLPGCLWHLWLCSHQSLLFLDTQLDYISQPPLQGVVDNKVWVEEEVMCVTSRRGLLKLPMQSSTLSLSPMPQLEVEPSKAQEDGRATRWKGPGPLNHCMEGHS